MSKQNRAYDMLEKILILGNTSVGKTCLLLRFCENTFTTENLSTIGIDFKMRTIEVDDKKVKMQVWDTSGQERFKTITQTYYKGAMGIILTYSVTDRESFEGVENWMDQIQEHASEDVCKILIGNKCDMPDRVVSYEEGKRLADSYGVQFFETSAKKDLNVHDAFKSIAREVKENIIRKQTMSEENKGTPIGVSQKIDTSPKTHTKKSGCC